MKVIIFILCFIASYGIAYRLHYEEYFQAEFTLTNINKIDQDVQHLLSQLSDMKKRMNHSYHRSEENCTDTDRVVNYSSILDIRVDNLPEKCCLGITLNFYRLSKTNTPPKNCAEATACTHRSGIYRVLLERYDTEAFLVECDVKTEGGGWTVIQRRQDGSENFYRNWTEYQRGFGSVNGEFFIGLEKLHALTNYDGPQELLVLLQDKNETKKAFYSNFVVGGEGESYALNHLGIYSGDAGDSLAYQLGAKFTTKDRNNGEYKLNCAQIYTGAWWYKECHSSNLNGKYGDKEYGKGVTWQTFRGYRESIQHTTMMIRRRSF